MASWIYVFGILTPGSQLHPWAILTGCVLAIMGPTWWHVSSVGLFVNSLHLWSVEAFFFFDGVIDLWGKFFMAAWEGEPTPDVDHRSCHLRDLGRCRLHRRSVPAELRLPMDLHASQGRHQRQWGGRHLQRLELRADADVAHRAPPAGRRRGPTGVHVLMVRCRGIVPPFEVQGDAVQFGPNPSPAETEDDSRARDAGCAEAAVRFNPDRDVEDWHGAYVPDYILKEALVALLVVGVLIAGLAIIFSSPDEHPVTLKSWTANDPVEVAQTAITELDGTSAVATYGPPYNATPDSSQSIGFFSPEKWFGVRHPVNTAQDFVIDPLRTLPNRPAL